MSFRELLAKHFSKKHCRDIFAEKYSDNILLSPTHIEAIAAVISLRYPGCKLLVFGSGYDSALWHALNKNGLTIFLESQARWKEIVLRDNPHLNIHLYEPVPITIDDYAKKPELLLTPPPEVMLLHKWDVILVDGPPGHSPDSPGRALTVKWASAVRSHSTHVFVHDYDRPLENFYVNQVFKNISILNCPRDQKLLAWSPGISESLMRLPH